MALPIFRFGIILSVIFLTPPAYGKPEPELGLGFTVEPSDVVIQRGRALTLPCRAWSTRGHLTLRWVRNDKYLDSDKRALLQPDGSLLIKKVQSKGSDGVGAGDQGVYRCIAHTPGGALSSRPAVVRISGVYDFLEVPSSLTVAAGSVARFACTVDAVPSATISWTKDDIHLPDGDKYLVSPYGTSGSLLYIRNVEPDDAGSYRCHAGNDFAKRTRGSPPAQLAVGERRDDANDKPSLLAGIEERSSFVVPHMSIATLECATAHSATPLAWFYLPPNSGNETWLRNGTSIIPLQLVNVTRGHSGTYICRTTSPQPYILQRIQVSVLESAELFERPKGQVLAVPKTVRFHCWTKGAPLPVHWLKNGMPVEINGRIKLRVAHNETLAASMSELIIISSAVKDAGVYQCVVEGAGGPPVWAAARLLHDAQPGRPPPPEPPTQVTCETIGATQVMVSWLAPVSPLAFSIHYSLTDGGEEKQEVVMANETSRVIHNLIPYANYSFSVRSYSTIESSDYSERAVCLTGEDVAIASPVVSVAQLSSTSVRVEWNPLPLNLSRGIATEYKVQWGKNGKQYREVEQIPAEKLSHVISGLTPKQDYEVRVLVGTRVGWPTLDMPWSKFYLPKVTNDSSVIVRPSLSVIAVNSSTVRASWNFSSVAAVLGSKLFIRPHAGQQQGPIILPPQQTIYLFDDLKPETTYEVSVLGYSADGDGEPASQTVHTAASEMRPVDGTSEHAVSTVLSAPELALARAPPDPPTGLEAEPVSSSAIRLAWTHARDVSYYSVCYAPVQTSLSFNKSIPCLQSVDNAVIVDKLSPYTRYEFKVRSHDRFNQTSERPSILEVPTMEEVPSALLDVNWRVINRTAVKVTWREPTRVNGLLKNYTISYTQDHNLPLREWSSLSVPSNKYSADLVNISSDVVYSVTVRAATGAGYGPVGAVIVVKMGNIKKAQPGIISPAEDLSHDQNLGVIVGCTIGVACIIACTICIMCRRRCSKSQCSAQSGPAPHADRAGALEMEYLSQYTTPQPQHVDTKGHYPAVGVNGVRVPLTGNGRVADAGIRITDNPRYESSIADSPILGLQSPRRPPCSDGHNDSHHPLLGEEQGVDVRQHGTTPPYDKSSTLFENYASSLQYGIRPISHNESSPRSSTISDGPVRSSVNPSGHHRSTSHGSSNGTHRAKSPRSSFSTASPTNSGLSQRSVSPSETSRRSSISTPPSLPPLHTNNVSTDDVNGIVSKGALYPHMRAKSRPTPPSADIFNVPDSPPPKKGPLIIDFQFV